MKIVEVDKISPRENVKIVILPETAIVRPGTPFFLPFWDSRWHFVVRQGVVITRLGKSIGSKFAHRYYQDVVLVLCAEAMDAMPASVKGFDGSILVSAPIAPSIHDFNATIKSLYPDEYNGNLCLPHQQCFTIPCERENIDEAIEVASKYFTLHTGDIVVIPRTIEAVIPAVAETRLTIEQQGTVLLNHKVK